MLRKLVVAEMALNTEDQTQMGSAKTKTKKAVKNSGPAAVPVSGGRQCRPQRLFVDLAEN